MSRIGKKAIAIPAGVTVEIKGSDITVKGPKGTLTRTIDSAIECKVEGTNVVLTCDSADKNVQAKHGLFRSLVNNMVVGVSSGFSRTVVINGVGYKAQATGDKLVLNIGYSHPVEMDAPKGIKFEIGATPTEIIISGFDKELVGQTAANVIAKRPIEPYHGYGVRYKEDVVILKEGKKAGK